MVYRVLADLTLIVHFGFVLFVALGGFLVLRWRGLAWAHLPAAAWGALIEFAGWICPLTPLENTLRRRGGEAGYEGGFIDHYIIGLIYPEGLTRSMQLVLGATVVIVNTLIYAWVFHGHRWRRRRPG
jgi:hypothetical protein